VQLLATLTQQFYKNNSRFEIELQDLRWRHSLIWWRHDLVLPFSKCLIWSFCVSLDTRSN